MRKKDKRNLPDLKNRGLFSCRLKHNPREAAFAEQWEKENVNRHGIDFGYGVLQDLFIDRAGTGITAREKARAIITPRDRFIVATVIQWLGSNCGMCFLKTVLERCGYAVRSTDDRHKSWRWQQTPPTEPGLYWWWNGDPNGEAIDVRLASANGAPTDRESGLYALPNQHGWNRFQKVTAMGGHWARCIPPEVPRAMRIAAAEKGGV